MWQNKLLECKCEEEIFRFLNIAFEICQPIHLNTIIKFWVDNFHWSHNQRKQRMCSKKNRSQKEEAPICVLISYDRDIDNISLQHYMNQAALLIRIRISVLTNE